jgi:hypothetical protein
MKWQSYIAILALFAFVLGGPAVAQNQSSVVSSSEQRQSIEPAAITLSPAVVMAAGTVGQSLSQRLSLRNTTPVDLIFDMVAQDVLIRDGKRVYVNAGEIPTGIANTAVFSAPRILVPRNTTQYVDVTLTIPQNTPVRAVVAIFRGVADPSKGQNSVGMIGSLGCLITFTISKNLAFEPRAVAFSPQTDATNLTISQQIANTGAEPVIPKGVAAILNNSGALVGKVEFPNLRLLPGEMLSFEVEYPNHLKPGKYRVVNSFEFSGATATKSSEFEVQ